MTINFSTHIKIIMFHTGEDISFIHVQEHSNKYNGKVVYYYGKIKLQTEIKYWFTHHESKLILSCFD